MSGAAALESPLYCTTRTGKMLYTLSIESRTFVTINKSMKIRLQIIDTWEAILLNSTVTSPPEFPIPTTTTRLSS